MIYISFMELVPEAGKVLNDLQLMLSFFGGIGLIAIIDFLIPEDENPHEIHLAEDMEKNSRLKRMGIMLALSIAIHNFPEGDCRFYVGVDSLEGNSHRTGYSLHDIPRQCRFLPKIILPEPEKAFWYSF
jgi:ZIP family zinc transporter